MFIDLSTPITRIKAASTKIDKEKNKIARNNLLGPLDKHHVVEFGRPRRRRKYIELAIRVLSKIAQAKRVSFVFETFSYSILQLLTFSS